MFGRNPVRAQIRGDGQRLWVQSLFHTLQGEGPLQGRPAIFLRLGGCNLRCFWCDTDFETSEWQPLLPELLGRIEDMVTQTGTRLIVLTGGEPFRQNIAPLIEALLGRGLSVQIETNGTLWVDLPEHDDLMIVCSPKTPTLNASLRARISAFKYVLGQDDPESDDGLPNNSTQCAGRADRLARPTASVPVYVSPRDVCDAAANTANMKHCAEVAMRHNYILTLQIHKILGLE